MKKGEIYDILDVNNRISGQAPWEEVHTKGLRHQVSGCFVFKNRDRKELLIQKRSHLMDQNPGQWNHSAGGHIGRGETPLEAMCRELSEELFNGVDVENLQISEIAVFENHDIPNNNEIFHLFEAFYNGPISSKNEEVDELKWINLNDLERDIKVNPRKYTPSFRNTLSAYNSKNG